MNIRPTILVFNSGSGSGFQELVENTRTGVLRADIIGLVTNNKNHECVKRAEELNIKSCVMTDLGVEDYKDLLEGYKPDFVALSGWLKKVPMGVFDPQRTINIHPGPLPEFGGPGMYGHHVHDAVMKAFHARRIVSTQVCMHYVIDEYDQGRVFFRYPVRIRTNDTSCTLAGRVNKIEHGWQSYITNLVVHGEIRWDGKNPESLVVPDWIRKSFL